MQEYVSNSHKSKQEAAAEEKKEIKKVVSGKVKTKKNDGRKFANIFISEDAANVKSYVFMDVLVPAIKKAVVDIVTDGINMVFYGDTNGGGRSKNRSGNKVSYRAYYDDDRRDRRDSGTRVGNRFDYDDLIFDSRGEAEAVLSQMDEVIDRYDFVTVADMYDMADLTAPYTANKYGWDNLRNAEVIRERGGGYIIKLPKARPR